MTVQAIQVDPPESIGPSINRIFCFRQQTLKVTSRHGLIFNIDREIPKQVHVVTLSYTLFAVTAKG